MGARLADLLGARFVALVLTVGLGGRGSSAYSAAAVASSYRSRSSKVGLMLSSENPRGRDPSAWYASISCEK
jgi:hypothetical protein